MLQFSRVWLADGTFKTAPLLFTQVYVIHALRGDPDLLKDGHLLPSIFILLPNKLEATYKRMWQQVQLLCPQAHPTDMLMDFSSRLLLTVFSRHGLTLLLKDAFFISPRIYGEKSKQ